MKKNSKFKTLLCALSLAVLGFLSVSVKSDKTKDARYSDDSTPIDNADITFNPAKNILHSRTIVTNNDEQTFAINTYYSKKTNKPSYFEISDGSSSNKIIDADDNNIYTVIDSLTRASECSSINTFYVSTPYNVTLTNSLDQAIQITRSYVINGETYIERISYDEGKYYSGLFNKSGEKLCSYISTDMTLATPLHEETKPVILDGTTKDEGIGYTTNLYYGIDCVSTTTTNADGNIIESNKREVNLGNQDGNCITVNSKGYTTFFTHTDDNLLCNIKVLDSNGKQLDSKDVNPEYKLNDSTSYSENEGKVIAEYSSLDGGLLIVIEDGEIHIERIENTINVEGKKYYITMP